MTVPSQHRKLISTRALEVLGYTGAALMAVIAPLFQLQTFGDGSIFSYAVAARQSWEFHWHNISGRLFTYFYAHVPAEAVAGLTGSAKAGIALYGALFYAAPLLALALTRAADATPKRTIFHFACASTLALCPFVFGAPTEMWMAHGLFWVALAVHLSRSNALAMFCATLALVFTHEGGVVFLAVILFAVFIHHRLGAAFARSCIIAAIAMVIWSAVKIAIRPDAYIDSVLASAAYRFIDPRNLLDPAFVSAAASVMAFLLFATALGVSRIKRPATSAFVVCAALLCGYWIFFDTSLLAEARYNLRTALLAFTPLFGMAAALAATPNAKLQANLSDLLMRPARLIFTPRHIAGAMTLLLLVHTYETTKFIRGWNAYRAQLAQLVSGPARDPQLGDARFVSAARLGPALNRLAWNSTTPYLSVLVSPQLRADALVIDPTTGYFWLSCTTATASARVGDLIPIESLILIRAYSCAHRKD